VSLASPSARVVYAALAGDLAVAAAKFGASALSGSTAMLTEAIHSLVDSADQILLLTGQSRARFWCRIWCITGARPRSARF
jgi:divalent metal cation (Fe/Co/Zn/Cd) transporter